MAPQEPTPRQLGTYLAMAQVGLEMVAPVGLGWWLDERLGWSPVLLIVGVILGLALGILHLVALSNRVDPDGDEPSKDPSSPPEDKLP